MINTCIDNLWRHVAASVSWFIDRLHWKRRSASFGTKFWCVDLLVLSEVEGGDEVYRGRIQDAWQPARFKPTGLTSLGPGGRYSQDWVLSAYRT